MKNTLYYSYYDKGKWKLQKKVHKKFIGELRSLKRKNDNSRILDEGLEIKNSDCDELVCVLFAVILVDKSSEYLIEKGVSWKRLRREQWQTLDLTELMTGTIIGASIVAVSSNWGLAQNAEKNCFDRVVVLRMKNAMRST